MDYQKIKILLDKIKLSAPKVLVLGDIMLDCYINGSVRRISPEAPVPILDFEKEKYILGGVGNVAHNLVNLGAEVKLLTIIGDDPEGQIIQGLIKKLKISLDYVHSSANINTTKKTRFISNSTQLLRLDTDSSGFKAVDYKLLKEKVKSAIGELDCIIISDYDKGVCSTDIIQYIISIADQEKIPIFIDPKGDSWSKYSNATCITPNKKEAEKELGVILRNDTDFEKAAQSICDKYNLKSCLITRGGQGLTYSIGTKIIHQGARKKEVFDVSGAGDTVISCMASSYISILKINDCLELSTFLASEVVAYSGTVPFSIEMIKSKCV
jgi:rfaE bifunctional protein kinase chain/domain